MTVWTAARLLLVMVLWAGCYPLIAIGEQWASHYLFAALRATLAGGALATMVLVLRKPLPKTRGAWASLAAVGLGSTTLGFVGMFHAARLVSPGIATVVASTQPLIAALLATYVAGERIQRGEGAGLLAGFSGILLLAGPAARTGNGAIDSGLAWIGVAAAGVAWSNVLLRRLAHQVDPAVTMAVQLLLGSIPLWGLALMDVPMRIAWNSSFTLSLLVLGLLSTALAFWLWQQALTEVTVNVANTFNFLTPVIGLVAGRLWFHERLTLIQLAGAALAAGAPLISFALLRKFPVSH